MIITISGTPGSGKSTIAQAISKELKLKHYYIGKIRRDIAKKKGMTLEEYNQLGETDPSTDIDVDNYQKELGKKEDNIIIEGRTSFFFIPHSIKIFIDVDLDEASKRILNDLKDKEKNKERNEGKAETIKQMKQLLIKRIDSDIKRYKKYYNIENAYDKKDFDIVINTTKLSKKDAIKETLKKIKRYKL
jgi:CMP/dCMP kinase